jgi:very-short-patch-repair endonuclease
VATCADISTLFAELPAVPVGVVIADIAFRACMAESGASHWGAVLREACIRGNASAPASPGLSITTVDASAPERVMFSALQAEVLTRDLFELHGTLSVKFGHQPIEIDLLCRHLRIAVEIDGFRHFNDQQAYRRDRRKDHAMQREGLYVLRFDADEILAGTHAPLMRIRDVIAHQRKTYG